MKVFNTIESWASNLGYIVEQTRENDNIVFVWHEEQKGPFKKAYSIEQVMNDILSEIKSAYRGD